MFQTAVINNTTKIAIAHNNPSGNIKPSENDIYFGQQVKKALTICGIDLIDFFVIYSDDYTSFAEKNYFNLNLRSRI
ncbi:JAB domain-containing protein [Pediococcus pentosaceus]|uniref:JAB domain-containing protein n=1 Tax=Pediococcus pentosaceus TaxID=1255 RepID=UPI00136275DE